MCRGEWGSGVRMSVCVCVSGVNGDVCGGGMSVCVGGEGGGG